MKWLLKIGAGLIITSVRYKWTLSTSPLHWLVYRVCQMVDSKQNITELAFRTAREVQSRYLESELSRMQVKKRVGGDRHDQLRYLVGYTKFGGQAIASIVFDTLHDRWEFLFCLVVHESPMGL